MKKYYEAYEERYKKIHEKGLLWFSDEPTPELIDWIKYFKIPKSNGICEVGCGEGRDSLYLAEQGYEVTGIDISNEAIKKCKELAEKKKVNINWIVSDALNLKDKIDRQFDWIYSIGTLHMLVEQEDRKKFLESIYSILKPQGSFLLISMGDGETERATDTSTAFDLQERNHMKSGRKLEVAGTSYRAINWENHEKELKEVGFKVKKKMQTENDEYIKCMTLYLTKE